LRRNSVFRIILKLKIKFNLEGGKDEKKNLADAVCGLPAAGWLERDPGLG
jgi:hypothetical protein